MPVWGRLFVARRSRPWHCALAPSAPRGSLHLPAPAACAFPEIKGSIHILTLRGQGHSTPQPSEIARPFFCHTLTDCPCLFRSCIVKALTFKVLLEDDLRLLLLCLTKAPPELCLPPLQLRLTQLPHQHLSVFLRRHRHLITWLVEAVRWR